MSIFHNNALLNASGAQSTGGYEITRSLRFNDDDTAYLSRTPSSAGNRRTWTWSSWIKRSTLGVNQIIFETQNGVASTPRATIELTSGDLFRLAANEDGSSWNIQVSGDNVLRDPSAWYHLVMVLDTTQATASDRVKLYINGVEVSYNETNYPDQNADLPINQALGHRIGAGSNNSVYLDGYLADVHFIDGQALAATDFGEYDDNNNWNPKQYSGSYGTNGFYLDFSDNSSNSALGTDAAGSNDWTPNNLVASQPDAAHIATGGDPTSSTENPFGSGQGHSVDFDGTGDQLRFTGPGLVDGDLTVECFYRMDTDASGYQRIFSTKEDSYSSEQTMIRRHTNGNLQFYFGNGNPEHQGGSISGNTWYHAAIVYDKSAETVSYYLDGSRLSTDSYNGTVRITEMVVGGGYSSENFKGYISNCRVTKQALYSGTSYTVPTSTLTTTSQGATANNVALLCCTTSTITAASGTSGNANEVDSMIDSPTNYTAESGNNGGNYCTLNPLSQSGGGTLSQGNLRYDLGSGTIRVEGTMAVKSGKWYWESTAISGTTNGTVGGRFGITIQTSVANPEQGPYNLSWHATAGIQKFISGSASTLSSGTSYGDGDVLGLALDADNNIAYFYKNGTLAYTIDFSGDVTAGSQFLTPVCWNGSSGTPIWWYNFGQRGFDYTPRTNHVSLCTANFDVPDIADGSTAFDATLWTGDGTNGQSVTGLGFSPDFLWAKARNQSINHAVFDTIRGTNPPKYLQPNKTSTEVSQTSGSLTVTAFNSDGFTFNDNTRTGANNYTYVGWAWDAGSSTASNTDGSITSSVRANQTAGFSIVTYTGNGTQDATVGHGLNATPDFVLTKGRTIGNYWAVHHSGLSSGHYLRLDLTMASEAASHYYNAMSSSVMTMNDEGTTLNNVNNDGEDYVSYCWTAVAGYSAFGTYTGTNSADGPFVYTGFRPKWLLIKNYSNSGNWNLFDTTRSTYNATGHLLLPNEADTEYTQSPYNDFLSNGFKVRTTDTGKSGLNANQDGNTYIWAAFAEHPFKTARAR